MALGAERIDDDMARVEILAAALSAFSRPVPDYEPAFRHMHHMALSAHELRPRHGDA